jgi:hypothetical protein
MIPGRPTDLANSSSTWMRLSSPLARAYRKVMSSGRLTLRTRSSSCGAAASSGFGGGGAVACSGFRRAVPRETQTTSSS